MSSDTGSITVQETSTPALRRDSGPTLSKHDSEKLEAAAHDPELAEDSAQEALLPAIGPPPDGGPTAWLTVTGASFCIFVQFGLSEC
jgi:hypothetical protein